MFDPKNRTIEDAWKGIPDEYRAICDIGKVRSTGWRNVSVVGFLGLLGLAAGIALASCEAESGSLWLFIAAEAVERYVRTVSNTIDAVIRSTKGSRR